MKKKLDRLRVILGEVADLNQIFNLVNWDQETYMPPGAAQSRSQQLATIAKIIHEKATAEEIGLLIDDLKPWAASLDKKSNEYRLITVVAKDFDKNSRIPPEFMAEEARVTSMARQAWMEARAKADFKLFQAHLEKILELNQRYVSFFPPKDHPYDLLLDNFEPGMKTADVKGIFDELRPLQIELIKAVGKHPQVDDAFLHLGYDEKKQWDFSVEVIRAVGYDLNRGRLDKSAHPFSTSFSMDDVRITTRFERDSGVSALFSSLHEAGHALYEQGFDPVWKRTPIADGSSLAMHESQSRLWENIIGRSRPFWEYYFPKLKALFPAQLNNVTLDQFYRGINKVQPSLIRVEADEATYNLHIMLRFELEIAMIEGKLPIKELPSAWNDKMQAYLGIVPPDDALGVLQDIHWSLGSLGYFPTYALGNLISAQLWEKYQSINSDISDQIRKGDFSALLAWLRDAIHQYGRKYEPKELVTRITRSNIDPTPYMRYLTAKFGEIYEL